jgi:hypothetical protein
MMTPASPPPRALPRARFDSLALVPASLLPFKVTWQRMANELLGPCHLRNKEVNRSGIAGHRADGNQAATSAANVARTAAGVWWP